MARLLESQYLDQATQIKAMQDASNDMLQASQDEYLGALQSKYDLFLKRVTADAKALRADIMEKFGQTTVTYADFLRHQAQLQEDLTFAKQLDREVMALNGDVNHDLLDQLESTYRDSFNLNAWTLDETTPPNIDVNYKMPPDLVLRQYAATSWTGDMFSQRIGAVNDMMANDIQIAMTQAMMSGDSAKDLAKRIADKVGDGSDAWSYRAGVIARTELLRSANMARQKVFDDNEDVGDDWIWVSRSLASGRLCEECAERRGHTYDEVKDIADEQEMELDPPAHPQCGCTWMPKVKPWWELLPPGVKAVGPKFTDEYVMAIPDNQGAVAKVTPMKFADWADRYLSETERGDL